MLLRPATADDLTFLTEMLLEACNWDGTPRTPPVGGRAGLVDPDGSR